MYRVCISRVTLGEVIVWASKSGGGARWEELVTHVVYGGKRVISKRRGGR